MAKSYWSKDVWDDVLQDVDSRVGEEKRIDEDAPSRHFGVPSFADWLASKNRGEDSGERGEDGEGDASPDGRAVAFVRGNAEADVQEAILVRATQV